MALDEGADPAEEPKAFRALLAQADPAQPGWGQGGGGSAAEVSLGSEALAQGVEHRL